MESAAIRKEAVQYTRPFSSTQSLQRPRAIMDYEDSFRLADTEVATDVVVGLPLHRHR